LFLAKKLITELNISDAKYYVHEPDNNYYELIGENRFDPSKKKNQILHENNKMAYLLNMPSGNIDDSNIFIVNNSVMEGFTPYIGTADINTLAKDFLQNNGSKKHKPLIMILDSTNARYSKPDLNEDTLESVKNGELVILSWESLQKKGLVGLDLVQTGRFVIIASGEIMNSMTVQNIVATFEKDELPMLERQVVAMFNHAGYNEDKPIQDQYQDLLYLSGQIIRQKLSTNPAIKGQSSNFFTDPQLVDFINAANDSDYIMQYRDRGSFGFNHPSFSYAINMVGVTGAARLSVGTQEQINIDLMATLLQFMLEAVEKSKQDQVREFIAKKVKNGNIISIFLKGFYDFINTIDINVLKKSDCEKLVSYLIFVQPNYSGRVCQDSFLANFKT
jgi:hypothetical protein